MISVRQVFHVVIVVYYMVATHLISENLLKHKGDLNLDPVVKKMQQFSFRYLTNWTFTLQSIYFFVALGEEVLLLFRGLEKLKERTRKFKNYLFTVLVAPMALVVTISFWAIWHIDRELIFPTVMDRVLPVWVNHSLHTTTSVLVLTEMYLCYHKYPAFKPALLGITLYLLIYSVCLVGTYLETGFWLYPIFKVLSWTLRVSVCLGVYVLAIAVYEAGYILNKALWGEKIAARATKTSKKKHKKH